MNEKIYLVWIESKFQYADVEMVFDNKEKAEKYIEIQKEKLKGTYSEPTYDLQEWTINTNVKKWL